MRQGPCSQRCPKNQVPCWRYKSTLLQTPKADDMKEAKRIQDSQQPVQAKPESRPFLQREPHRKPFGDPKTALSYLRLVSRVPLHVSSPSMSGAPARKLPMPTPAFLQRWRGGPLGPGTPNAGHMKYAPRPSVHHIIWVLRTARAEALRTWWLTSYRGGRKK